MELIENELLFYIELNFLHFTFTGTYFIRSIFFFVVAVGDSQGISLELDQSQYIKIEIFIKFGFKIIIKFRSC